MAFCDQLFNNASLQYAIIQNNTLIELKRIQEALKIKLKEIEDRTYYIRLTSTSFAYLAIVTLALTFIVFLLNDLSSAKFSFRNKANQTFKKETRESSSSNNLSIFRLVVKEEVKLMKRLF